MAGENPLRFLAALGSLIGPPGEEVQAVTITWSPGSWPGRLRQIHSFFRARSPYEMLATAAPWTSPWLPPGYEQNYWNAA